MTYQFDFKTRDFLRRQGWHENRKTDIAKYKAAWKSEAYVLTQAAIRFSENMGGLTIQHEAYRAPGQTDRSSFDPVEAVNRLDSLWVFEDYQLLSKSKLCPVGLGFSSHMRYLISEQGELYGAYDSHFCLIGRTVEEAMENLLFLHQFKTVSE